MNPKRIALVTTPMGWLVIWGVLALVLGVGFAFTAPLPQNAGYHDFADQRSLLGVPHFWNVVSNAVLLLAGLAGLVLLAAGGRRGKPLRFRERTEGRLFFLFCLGVALTAVGSAYYHLAPDSARLFWDRLPLGLATACLPAMMVAERLRLGKLGRALLWGWVTLGPLSVLYWHLGELRGMGDLRPYGLVQFGAMLAVLLMLLTLPPRMSGSGHYGWALACYGLAKVCELADGSIFALGGLTGGHSLKHMLAGVAVALIVRMMRKRDPVTP
ncbi:MAG: alkaline phytoceramidase [SAR324 cluster bacterium]|nr:alkaline phytoceramidase [SAR324 cluster bacterium]